MTKDIRHPAILLLVCPSLGMRRHEIFIGREAGSEVVTGMEQPMVIADSTPTDEELLYTGPVLVGAAQHRPGCRDYQYG